jgi:PAS domain S-box-containing protein
MGCAASSLSSPVTSELPNENACSLSNELKCKSNETIVVSLRYIEEQLEYSILKDGIGLLVKSSSARIVFIKFLKEEYKNEAQPLADIIERLDNDGTKPLAVLRVNADAEVIEKSYDSSDALEETFDRRSLSFDYTETPPTDSPCKRKSSLRRKSLNRLVYSQQGYALFILSAFPYFANSRAYEDWCESESANPIDLTDGPLKSLRLFRFSSKDAFSSVDRIIESIPSMGLSSYLHSKFWLHCLFSTTEDLPVCISFAAASQSQRGFPLIHVNKMFETTTGYSKSEVIGKNCSFLQSGGYSEPAQIEKISEALRNHTQIKVKLTNYRKDGSRFKNLLALKPIFDTDGKYCFVMGILIDCSANEADEEQIRLVNNLFYMLPNIMYVQK